LFMTGKTSIRAGLLLGARASGRLLIVLLALVATVALTPAVASATAPIELWQVPEVGSRVGIGAGEIDHPSGVAASPVSGDVYVADSSNARIDEFTAWGEFVRAFGWGVVASGPDDKPSNARQEVAVSATSGAFKLVFTKSRQIPEENASYEQVTAPIEYDASAAGVQAALEALESVGAGGVQVSGPAGGPWTIEFTGNLADVRIDPLSGNKETLAGAGASVTVKMLQVGAAYEVCEPAKGDVCTAGQFGGTSAGEIEPRGVATDSQGDVYVYESREEADPRTSRVQKFSPDGEFMLMFGGRVDVTTGADVCTAANLRQGDECGGGIQGSEQGEFRASALAVGPEGTVYVGDVNRIDEFTDEGAYKGQIGLPTEGEVKGGATEGKGIPASLAVDAHGALYLDFVENYVYAIDNQPNIYKYNGSSWSLFAEQEYPRDLAVDTAGNVYAVNRGSSTFEDILGYGPQGEKLIPDAQEALLQKEMEERNESFFRFGQLGDYTNEQDLTGVATSSACGIPGADVYATYAAAQESTLRAYGPTPDPSQCAPPRRAPLIADQYAVSADTSSAVVRASINAHFWADASYEVEYGTEPCSRGGCAHAGVGEQLGSKSNLLTNTEGVLLAGLSPGTTYHFRFVAHSGGGGPVDGVGGEVGKEGAEATFTTAPSPLPVTSECPNQAHRSGVAASLPDCRAYELVSPIDKQGGDIAVLGNIFGYPASLDRASTSGERLTYSTYSSIEGAVAAPFSSQYLASRSPATGWTNKQISPPRGRAILGAGLSADVEFHAFSPDLCQGWLRLDFETEPVLDPAAVKGYPNIFKKDLCGEKGYEALTTVRPEGTIPGEYLPLELQGFSADGSRAMYVVDANLTPDAKGSGAEVRLYDFADGALHFVCILPDGTPVPGCSAGNYDQVAAAPGHQGRMNDLTGAMSEDGTRIFWSRDGDLYLRENPEQPQSAISGGKCAEKTKACTIAVSEKVSQESAQFWSASADGTRVLFTMTDGDLYEYSVTKNKATLIAEGAIGVMGASEDASRVYFASNKALAGTASAGQPNLYYYEAGGGALKFVATLTQSDVGESELAAVSPEPISRASRVSSDGLHATFMSSSNALGVLTAGYDNVDQLTGEDDEEVYRYDASTGSLACISCNPTGARPVGRNIIEVGRRDAAALIPTWDSDLYGSRVMSDDGTRVFFDSFEPLVPRDTNGKEDVYEWEAAASRAACEALGAELYVVASGGCLSLISSGTDTQDSEFVDASPSGGDVFFTTGASLVPQDPGQIDIYDARVDGGFAAPATPTACEGESCQNPPVPVPVLTPGSFSFSGAGNLATPLVPEAPKRPSVNPPTMKQKLGKALKACRAKPKSKRKRCEALARKRYRAKRKAKGSKRAKRAATGTGGRG
jgi:DNA-binding beta-propeller fold protein YncE